MIETMRRPHPSTCVLKDNAVFQHPVAGDTRITNNSPRPQEANTLNDGQVGQTIYHSDKTKRVNDNISSAHLTDDRHTKL
jgi:hypothetical protein